MNAHLKLSAIPPEIAAAFQEALEAAAKGTRDLEKARAACKEMDEIREEIRKEHGVLEIGVPAIRELRDA